MRYEDVEHKVTTVFGQPLDLHYMNNEVRKEMNGVRTAAYLFSLCLTEDFLVCFSNIIICFHFLEPYFLVLVTLEFLEFFLFCFYYMEDYIAISISLLSQCQ